MAGWKSANERKTPRYKGRYISLAKKPSMAWREWLCIRESGMGDPSAACQQARGPYPYSTLFHDLSFDYPLCRLCASVVVYPVPETNGFVKINFAVAYNAYCADREKHESSAGILCDLFFAAANTSDYDCGLGLFLKTQQADGWIATGVELDHANGKKHGLARVPTNKLFVGGGAK